MKHPECKDCKLREGDCGHHFKMDGITDYDIPSQSACDQYDDCMFFQPKPKAKRNSERPQGEWKIIADVYCKCPFCSNVEVKFSNYCPECGARLEGGAE